MNAQDHQWLLIMLTLLGMVLGWAICEALQPPLSNKIVGRNMYREYTAWTDYTFIVPRLVGLSLVRKFQRRLVFEVDVKCLPNGETWVEYRAHPSKWWKIHNK